MCAYRLLEWNIYGLKSLPVLSANKWVTKPSSSLISEVRQTAGIFLSSSYLNICVNSAVYIYIYIFIYIYINQFYCCILVHVVRLPHKICRSISLLQSCSCLMANIMQCLCILHYMHFAYLKKVKFVTNSVGMFTSQSYFCFVFCNI